MPDMQPEPDHRPTPPRPVILLVEDEALIALHLQQVLIEAGYEVFVAFNGDDAIAQARTISSISLVVTDIHLQFGRDGRSVLRELRAGNPLLPAVVTTGFSQWIDEADLRGLGGPTARLAKPFLETELIASIAGVLTRPEHASGERRRRDRAPFPA